MRDTNSPPSKGKKKGGRTMQTSIEPTQEVNGLKHRKTAAMLSIIPGIGQLYNKQYVKGIIFLVLTCSFL